MEDEIQQATEIYQQISTYLITHSIPIVVAIVIFIIGYIIAAKVSTLVLNILLKRNIDITLSNFAASCLKIVIVAMMAIISLEKIGLSITPFVAAIGAVSLGIGLALQGLLANYGAGVAIILTRPFVVGDTVTLLGVSGVVSEVKLGYTILVNEDGVLITIPNKHVMGEIIQNSNNDSIVEVTVGIAYHCDPDQAISVITRSLEGLEGCSVGRTPIVGIENFGDSSIDIGVRFWVKTQEYYQTRYRANSAIHKALQKAQIEIPFPQRDVRLYQADQPASAD